MGKEGRRRKQHITKKKKVVGEPVVRKNDARMYRVLYLLMMMMVNSCGWTDVRVSGYTCLTCNAIQTGEYIHIMSC